MKSLEAGDPERVGDYRLLWRLGAGGMGRVYLARSAGGRTVAVKLVHQELADQPEFRTRFAREIRAAQRVGGDWTAPVLDSDTEAPSPWVATGYIPGPSLHEVVAERSWPLPERTLLILADRLTLALRAIHGVGLIHRDLKPSNIMITIDGPRVIDFGIARALETLADGLMTRTGTVVGSPGFMSPEQVVGVRVTPASDVFCLGSVLAFAATKRTPFGSMNTAGHTLMYRIVQEEPDLTGLPESLRELVASCLAKEPEDRPSVDEILRRIGAAEHSAGMGAAGTGAADAPQEPWLPGDLVATLGRHAAQLLDAEIPAAAPAAAEPAEPAEPEPQPQLSAERAQQQPPQRSDDGTVPLRVPSGEQTPQPSGGSFGPPPAYTAAAGGGGAREPHGPTTKAADADKLTAEMLAQITDGLDTVSVSAWNGTAAKFARLVVIAEEHGYGYADSSASLTKPPTLILHRVTDRAPQQAPATKKELRARLTLDSMGGHVRRLTLLVLVLMGGFGITWAATAGSVVLYALFSVGVLMWLRRRKRTAAARLLTAGYRPSTDHKGRTRYLLGEDAVGP
ncbi:serine/threonine protein kinase [Streptomyces sp. N2-109]|uniref:Serine/threonine protein kinase n=1 Tax=Streptomyces gossypii TaxID=2883101 RepID=A0ABT2JVP1_9ACTN|nr:serine/threonine-protein kinase [Streptomyces gossypii]MCT2591951.1 serine/threonine protein kinase [Streptomyces gossypii]